MRLSRAAIIPIVIIPLCCISAAVSLASTVTVDLAGKTVTSDDSSLEPFGPQFSGQQAGVCVNNKLAQPQKFVLRCSGLTEPEYTLYINGESKGTRSPEQLKKGLNLQVDGSISDPGMIRCLSSLSPSAQKLHDQLTSTATTEAQFVCDAMRQVLEWAKLTLAEDQTWRSVRVIIAPADKALQTMEWVTRHSDYDTASIITNTCWALQQTRDQFYHQLKDSALRNDSIAAVTPTEFSASYAIRNGKPHVYVKLLNKCDLPLKGAISLKLPAGWKAVGAKMQFAGLKSGQSHVLSCDLARTCKSAVPPTEVPVTADVLIIQLDKSAALKLSTTAKAADK